MKILHIATGFPIGYHGGITNYVRSIAEAQVEAKNEVWVLSGEDAKKDSYPFLVECYKSDKIIPFKWRNTEDKEGLNKIQSFLDKECFDLIHVHMALDIDWDLYQILKPYKYVVSLHDYFFLCPRIQMLMYDNALCTAYDEDKCSKCISWFNMHKITNATEYHVRNTFGLKKFRFPEIPQKMTTIRYHKYKELLENAEVLLPVSNRVKEIFVDSGIRGKYKVLHIGNITADCYKEEFDWEENKAKIDVVMLGSLSYLKGGDLFVEIAKRLDKEKFCIHFYGRSVKYKEALFKAGIVDHGEYKQDELPTILAHMDLGLMLSVWEDNGPQVVMELLNNHVPVVATKMGGVPDFVNQSNGFLFDPYSDEDIERIVNELNALTREEIYKLKKSIRPTTTTGEHLAELNEVYASI